MDKKEKYVYEVFQSIAQNYDRANMRISAGLHMSWKRAGIRAFVKSLSTGASVLDLGCGTGDIIRLLYEKRSDLKLSGVDFSPKMLDVAKQNLQNIPCVSLKEGNVTSLSEDDNSFDGVTISFALRNTSGYEKVLREVYRVLRSGGVFMCIDSFIPENPVIKPFYSLYFNVFMPFIGGGIRKRKQYKWLSGSTRNFISYIKLMKMMREAGFRKIRFKRFLFGSCVCVIAKK